MMHYIYFLYSDKIDKYYIGYSTDIISRIEIHNNSPHNTFTSKGRPWVLKAAFSLENKNLALEMEKWLKKQKSRVLIEKIIDKNFLLTGKLAQLVRVPKLRD